MALDDESLDFDLVASGLRADATDLNTFVEVLAAKLETALPSATQVKRVKQGFRGPKLVSDISVEAGGSRLELHRRGDAVEARRAKTSGGIVLKSEQMDIDDWLGVLTEILQVQAQRSAQTRQALARLLDTT
jgi:hypothetical protein